MASAAHGTENPIAHQNQNQQQVLKCPRCDSSNTKFCYYNNYSLSQPRHFCKACKRYWTRGGTLRNVPVGGGCRKNKRIKRTFTDVANQGDSTTVTFCHKTVHNSNPNLDHVIPNSSTTSNNNRNPLLYGLLKQNPTYPTYTRVSNTISDTNVSWNDLLLHPQMSSLGLGFSSVPDLADTVVANHAQNSLSLVSTYRPSIFSGGYPASEPMMASHSDSSLQQQGFSLYGDRYGSLMNDVQMEGTKSRTDWNNVFHSQIDNHQLKDIESSDRTSFPWSASGSEWLDPTSNICSSLSSLI